MFKRPITITGSLLLLSILFWTGCIENPDFPDTPQIEYIGLSKSNLHQNSLNTDSLFVVFSFTDGDGNFGNEAADFMQNIVLIDNRTNEIYDSYKAPTIPPQGASKGISGEITVRIYTTCCIFTENIPPCESPPDYPTNSLTIDIYIIDRNGNESNRITTEPINLICD